MTFAIFGAGPLPELPPIPKRTPPADPRPLRYRSRKACVVCGAPFLPSRPESVACSLVCRGQKQTADSTTRVRAGVLAALTDEPQPVVRLRDATGSCLAMVLKVLAALEADGLARSVGVGRARRWVRA